MRGQPAEVQEFLRALGRVDAAEIAATTPASASTNARPGVGVRPLLPGLRHVGTVREAAPTTTVNDRMSDPLSVGSLQRRSA
jgi:hypothetical protein